MAELYTIARNFQNWRGLHKGFTDMNRPPGFSDTAQNCLIDSNFDLIQRPGCKLWSQTNGTAVEREYRGLGTYYFKDKDTGEIKQELIAVASDASAFYKLTTGTLTLTYSGGAAQVLLDFKPNASNVWELDIREDGTSISGFPKTYGTGLENSPTPLTTLVSDIDGLANYTATASFTTDIPAAILPIEVNLDITSGATITYHFFTVLNSMSTTPDLSSQDVGFVNPSFLNINNILFIAFGDYLFKYDGQNAYRAGMGKPWNVTSTAVTGSATLTGSYRYLVSYKLIDNQGNVIEGVAVESEDNPISVSSQDISLLINVASQGIKFAAARTTFISQTILPATPVASFDSNLIGKKATLHVKVGTEVTLSSEVTILDIDTTSGVETVSIDTPVSMDAGFGMFLSDSQSLLIRSEEVNGTQTDVNTINVKNINSDLNVNVGDTVYFYDTKSAKYVTRNVISRTSSSITLDGTSVSVDNSTGISTNLRVEIYRTKAGGSIFYLVDEITNDFLNAANSYTDSTPDSDLGAQYLAPVRTPNPPPKLKYIISHQGLPVGAGDPDNPNTVYFAEPLGLSEAWPDRSNLAKNLFDIPFTTEGPITGLGVENGVLIVFKKRERALIHGSLASDTFSIELVSDGIGCSAHHSIQQIPGGLVWISPTGPQKMVQGQIDKDFNSRLAIDFKNQFYQQTNGTAISSSEETKLVPERTTSINDSRRQIVIWFVPAESGTPGTRRYPNSNSKWYIYDYKNEAIFEWVRDSKLNAYGGMTIYKGELYFLSSYAVGTNNPPDVAGNLLKEHGRGDQYDAADNTNTIAWKVTTEWDSVNEPSKFAKYLRFKAWLNDPSLLANAITFTIKSFRNFLSTLHSQFTLAFTTSTKEKKAKFKNAKSRSFKVELSNDVLHECPRLSGYEYEVVSPFMTKIKE